MKLFFEKVKVTEDKEIMSNRHRLEETQETQQQRAAWAPGSDPGVEKDMSGKNDESQIKPVYLINCTTPN